MRAALACQGLGQGRPPACREREEHDDQHGTRYRGGARSCDQAYRMQLIEQEQTKGASNHSAERDNTKACTCAHWHILGHAQGLHQLEASISNQVRGCVGSTHRFSRATSALMTWDSVPWSWDNVPNVPWPTAFFMPFLSSVRAASCSPCSSTLTRRASCSSQNSSEHRLPSGRYSNRARAGAYPSRMYCRDCDQHGRGHTQTGNNPQ